MTYHGDTFILVAEARALCDRLRLAIQVGFNNIVIEGDNKIVIQVRKGNIQFACQVSNIIEYIRIWQNKDIYLLITHIFRKANMTTDWLLNFGH